MLSPTCSDTLLDLEAAAMHPETVSGSVESNVDSHASRERLALGYHRQIELIREWRYTGRQLQFRRSSTCVAAVGGTAVCCESADSVAAVAGVGAFDSCARSPQPASNTTAAINAANRYRTTINRLR